MIQRIQSVFLLLSGASFASLFGLSFASSDLEASTLFEDQVYNIFDHPALIILTVLGVILALVNIFLFKNRKLQINLGFALMALAILLIIFSILLVYLEGVEMGAGGEISERFGLAMPVLAIIFAILANRSVKKDEKLVKSMDRLR